MIESLRRFSGSEIATQKLKIRLSTSMIPMERMPLRKPSEQTEREAHFRIGKEKLASSRFAGLRQGKPSLPPLYGKFTSFL